MSSREMLMTDLHSLDPDMAESTNQSNLNSLTSPKETEMAAMSNEKRTKQIAQEFMETTSAHGWGRVVRTKNKPLRCMWVMLTLAALTINVLHCSLLIIQYLQFPYEQVSRVEVDEIAFPSVTVCNIQSISMTAARELVSNSSTKFSQWNNTTNFFFERLSNTTNDTVTFRRLYDRLRGPRGFYENIGDELDYLAHQPQDFILSCLYSLQPCTWRNFTREISSTYYNCFTFNGGNVSDPKLIAKMTGPQAGLSLVLYLESDNGDFFHSGPYYSYLNVGNSAGVRVIVHSPDTWPSPIDHGFDIPPGYSSSVALEVLRHERLGDPYSKCRSTHEIGNSRYNYSGHECIAVCQQEHVVNRCECISAELPLNESHRSSYEFCGYFNDSKPTDIFNKTQCELDAILEFLTDEKLRESCRCWAPCSEYEYKTDVSYSFWPIDFSQETFYNLYVAENPEREQLKAWQNLNSFNISQLIFYGLIRKNFIRLNVYIKSLVIHEYLQKGSYTFFNLFSDIGGTFGLWIGMSLLTWGEVIELMIKIIIRWCNKMVYGVSKAGKIQDTNQGQAAASSSEINGSFP